jgi:transposase
MKQRTVKAPASVARKDGRNAVPTIWYVPDDLWAMMERILLVYDPAPVMGRPRIDQRKALNGIIYRARTGCQWNHLPREFGDDVSVHRTMQRWERKGLFDILWAVLLTKCDLLRGVDWSWQSADCALGKARGAGKRGVRTKTIPVQTPLSASATPKNASGRTLLTAPSKGSRRACLPKAEAVRLASS